MNDKVQSLLQKKDEQPFAKGTFVWWKSLMGPGGTGNKIIEFIDKHLIQEMDALMVQAFGSSYKFKRVGADLIPLVKDNVLSAFRFKAVFFADVIKEFTGDPKYVTDDEKFFLESLRRLPGVHVDDESARMDVKTGRMIFNIIIPLDSV